ncbi:MAG: hypothetical protein ACOCRO_06150 [Halanaerobiales bacterium]
MGDKFIFFKNAKRIFLNTSLGCKANCSYCYLTNLNYTDYKTITVEKLLRKLRRKKSIKMGDMDQLFL